MSVPRGIPGDHRELAAMIADLEERVARTEVALSRRTGWVHIGTEVLASGAAQADIDVPPGVFTQLRVTAVGATSTTGAIYLRLNGVTASVYSTGYVRWLGDGTVGSSANVTAVSVAHFGYWGTTAGIHMAEALIFETHNPSGLGPYMARSQRGGTTTATSDLQLSKGYMPAGVGGAIDSVSVVATSGQTITGRFTVEGLRERSIALAA